MGHSYGNAYVRKKMVAQNLEDQFLTITRNFRKNCWTLRTLESLLWNGSFDSNVRFEHVDLPPSPSSPDFETKWDLHCCIQSSCAWNWLEVLSESWLTVCLVSWPGQAGPGGSCCHLAPCLWHRHSCARSYQHSFGSLNLTCSSQPWELCECCSLWLGHFSSPRGYPSLTL